MKPTKPIAWRKRLDEERQKLFRKAVCEEAKNATVLAMSNTKREAVKA